MSDSGPFGPLVCCLYDISCDRCYRCVTTANILLQVIVDSVAGGDDSDGFIKYILH